MKKDKYTVCFSAGTITVYCNGFNQAAILGMSEAISKGWDYRPLIIRSDDGCFVDEIKFPTYRKANFK